jgi:hypothetical protein
MAEKTGDRFSLGMAMGFTRAADDIRNQMAAK